MKKNLLITGGAGYIGSHVAHSLIDRGDNVTIIDNLITGHKELVPKQAKLIVSDISDVKKVDQVIKEGNFECVLHFAGLIRVDESVREPEKYNNYNYKKSKMFLDLCIKNNLNKIIFSSTASVYGNSPKNYTSEEDKIDPLNPYAKSKLKFEKYLIEMKKKKLINYTILRYFNVAGADPQLRTGLISDYSTHLIKVACEVAVGKRAELIINGNDYETKDGTPVRDYIHISDLVDIHIICAEDLINKSNSNIFNCGYGDGYSVLDVINNFNKIIEKKLPVRIGPRRPSDSKYIVADSNKFRNYFNWKPKYNNLDDIIQTAIAWEKKIINH